MHSMKVKNVGFPAVVDIANPPIFTPTILSLDGLASGFFATGSEWFLWFHGVSMQLHIETYSPEKLAVKAWSSAGFRDAIVSSTSRP